MLLDALTKLAAPPLCAGCGADARSVEPLCARCRRDLRWLGSEPARAGPVETWAPVAYEGPARGVVGALKFRGARRAADAMAAVIVAGAPPGWLAGRTLVPVPLHPSRARRRGYNQAGLLASSIARRTASEVRDCLSRAGPRGTQVGRDRAQRLVGIEGTITWTGSAAPRRAVLVDDVVTTGATLAACRAALRRAGSEEVVALVFARTPGR